MALSTDACLAFNSWLGENIKVFFPKKLVQDRFPQNAGYLNMWPQEKFPSFLGTELTWRTIHVTRPNDDGCWEVMDAGDCAQAICNPERHYTGWGESESIFNKRRRVYSTPIFCFDQLRHLQDIKEKLNIVVEGHRDMSKGIMSDFIRLLSVQQSDKLHIAGSADLEVDVTDGMFAVCNQIDLGSDANLPTSELTMDYLDNHAEDLQSQGYFNKKLMPQGVFQIMADSTTWRRLSNKNPNLVSMYTGADFQKGGRLYSFGVMPAVGQWARKDDDEPMRYNHIGDGILQRVFPYNNVTATKGKKPEWTKAYKNAKYQFYHVYNRDARNVYVGDVSPVGNGMDFNIARDMMGKWSWVNPGRGLFRGKDPNTGEVCTMDNTLGNMGFFMAEFEVGMRTIFPNIEMWILALREPVPVFDSKLCRDLPITYNSGTPYNPWCGDEE